MSLETSPPTDPSPSAAMDPAGEQLPGSVVGEVLRAAWGSERPAAPAVLELLGLLVPLVPLPVVLGCLRPLVELVFQEPRLRRGKSCRRLWRPPSSTSVPAKEPTSKH